ncbi:MAG: divalent-cation tolerance protein CutA [Aeromonas sp.]
MSQVSEMSENAGVAPATPEACVVLCSCPSEAIAQEIAHALLQERLAACVQVQPAATALYRWQGAIETAQEVGLVIKSRLTHKEALSAVICARHPYTTPEIIVLPIVAGLPAYLTWLTEETA